MMGSRGNFQLICFFLNVFCVKACVKAFFLYFAHITNAKQDYNMTFFIHGGNLSGEGEGNVGSQ